IGGHRVEAGGAAPVRMLDRGERLKWHRLFPRRRQRHVEQEGESAAVGDSVERGHAAAVSARQLDSIEVRLAWTLGRRPAVVVVRRKKDAGRAAGRHELQNDLTGKIARL